MSRLDQEEIFLFNGLVYQFLLDHPHEDLVGVTAKELREHYGLSPKTSYKFSAVLGKYQRLFYLVGQDRSDAAGAGQSSRVRYFISLRNPDAKARTRRAGQMSH